MFSIDNFPPKNLSATNCFRQQKYFERVFWETGRTFFFWLNEISTTKNMADTFSVAHISAVALSGTTSHPDLNSIEDPWGGSPPPPHIWQPQPDAARIWKLSDSRQTCWDSARLWQILNVFFCFSSTRMGKITGGSTGGNVFGAIEPGAFQDAIFERPAT